MTLGYFRALTAGLPDEAALVLIMSNVPDEFSVRLTGADTGTIGGTPEVRVRGELYPWTEGLDDDDDES